MSETAAKKDVQKLQRAIVDGLEDVKAHDIRVFNTEHLSPLFERVIVATGNSNRQTKALAASVRDKVREAGFAKPRIEGEDNGEWIVVDCGPAVAHVMQPAIRQYYNLEEIWGEKPVRLRSAAPQKPPAQAKAARQAAVAAQAPASKKKQAPAPATKASAATKKIATKKAATTPRGAEAKAPARQSAAAKAPARKSAVAKAPAKTAAPKPAPTRAVARPAAKPAAKSAAKPTAKPATRSAAKPAAQSTAKPAAKKAAPRQRS